MDVAQPGEPEPRAPHQPCERRKPWLLTLIPRRGLEDGLIGFHRDGSALVILAGNLAPPMMSFIESQLTWQSLNCIVGDALVVSLRAKREFRSMASALLESTVL